MEVKQVLGGRYELLDQLGSGGMAVVWRARDEVLGRSVAVKLLAGPDASDPGARRRIRDEARAAAMLSHPNIAQVYDYGESYEDGDVIPYVVMELVPGGTLAQRLMAAPMSAKESFRVCSEVAAALAAAHADSLVHRDIKPANVMVTSTGAKVVDFGIAAAIGSGGPGEPDSELLGTPAYLAPERLTGGAVEPASDVYALGVMLYRMLAGHSPWTADTTTKMLAAHMYVEPTPLPPLPEVPDYVTGLVNRCLSKDPMQRPSARETAALLAHAAGIRVVDQERAPVVSSPAFDDEPSGAPVSGPAFGAVPASSPPAPASPAPASPAPASSAPAGPPLGSPAPASTWTAAAAAGSAPGPSAHPPTGLSASALPAAAGTPAQPGGPIPAHPGGLAAPRHPGGAAPAASAAPVAVPRQRPAPATNRRRAAVAAGAVGAGVVAGLVWLSMSTGPYGSDVSANPPAFNDQPGITAPASGGPARGGPTGGPAGGIPARGGATGQPVKVGGPAVIRADGPVDRLGGQAGATAGGPTGPAGPAGPDGGSTGGPGATPRQPGNPGPTGGSDPDPAPQPTRTTARPTTAAPQPDQPQPRTFSSTGGSVRATCASSGSAEILSWSPKSPYKVKDSNEGPAAAPYVQFKHGNRLVKVTVTCSGGVPSSDVS